MNREVILSVKEISYSYEHGKTALDKVSLDIGRGEKIAAVGSNGAGKSTCFLCMNGVLMPDLGEIHYGGYPVGKNKLNELRRGVGIVFQDPDSQIVASSVFSEVAFGPVNLKLPREEAKERTQRALGYMDISELADRPPHYLSGGEKKKVTVADIIAMQPEIFIFDEPAASLDPLGRQSLNAVFERLHEEGKTLIISTHDMDFAYGFAKRLLVFSKGRVIADGKPEDIFADRELLEEAGLEPPVLWTLYWQLVKEGKISEGKRAPRDVKEFLSLFEA